MYRIFLLSIFLVILIFKPIFNKQSKDGYHPYLYVGSTNLSQHLISKEIQKPKIVLLGNSSIAGNNIPRDNNLSAQLNKRLTKFKSYNLGVLGASTTTLMTLYKLSLEYEPKAIVIGLNPGLFASSETGPLVWRNLEKIQSLLSQEQLKREKEQQSLKQFLSLPFINQDKVSYPPEPLIDYKSFLFRVKEQLYGPTMGQNIWGTKGTQVLDIESTAKSSFSVLLSLIQSAKSKDLKVIAFFDPIYKLEKTYKLEDYVLFKDKVAKKLRSLGVSVFDYSQSLTSSSENFLDYIHLNPMGNQRLSELLQRDLQGVNLD